MVWVNVRGRKREETGSKGNHREGVFAGEKVKKEAD